MAYNANSHLKEMHNLSSSGKLVALMIDTDMKVPVFIIIVIVENSR